MSALSARHAKDVGPEIEKLFLATGKLRLVFANNPLPNHANAKLLATAAICAGQEMRYWEAHDVLFSAKPRTKDDLIAVFNGLDLNMSDFSRCLEGNVRAVKRLEGDMAAAEQLKLQGTPSFVIGTTDAQGRIHVRKLISGANPLSVFEKAINELLSSD